MTSGIAVWRLHVQTANELFKRLQRVAMEGGRAEKDFEGAVAMNQAETETEGAVIDKLVGAETESLMEIHGGRRATLAACPL